MTRLGVSVYGSITIFGLFTALVSLLVMYWHRRNLKTHPEELRTLLEIARSDNH
jgi:hypothetical protein